MGVWLLRKIVSLKMKEGSTLLKSTERSHNMKFEEYPWYLGAWRFVDSLNREVRKETSWRRLLSRLLNKGKQ